MPPGNKYEQLGMQYTLEEGDFALTEDDLSRIEDWVRAYRLPVSVVHH